MRKNGMPRDKYWCVMVTNDLSPDGRIWLHSDDVVVTKAGALQFICHLEEKDITIMVIPPGKWLACYVVLSVGGAPVRVEQWKGVYERNPGLELVI